MNSTKGLLLSGVLSAGLLSAQVASVGLKAESPHMEAHSLTPHMPVNSQAAAPVAGYLLGPGAADIRSILTVSKTVKMGDVLAVPAATKRLYLPPRQQYALVEQNSSEPVAVWSLRTPDLITISGAMAHPDLVVFSPRGESMLLYSQASSSVQVVTHLPAEPALSRSIPVLFAAFQNLAVSDDGSVVVALFSDGSLVQCSNSHVWSLIHTRFLARALSFIPKTHMLAVIDSAQKMIVQLSNIESTSGMTDRIIGQEIEADQLLATRGGEELVAANRARGEIWTIDVKTSAISHQQEAGKIDDLVSLRDGYTFLLSNSLGLSLLRLAEVTH